MVDLIGEEIRCMCYLKKNNLDKSGAYILTLVGHMLYLKLHDNALG